jgi:hypothetical protein
MAFNASLIEGVRNAVNEINQRVSDMEDLATLCDVLGEAQQACADLAKAIDAAKKAIRETELSVIEGNNWHITVITNERAIVDQSKVRSILGDETPMKVTNVTSVKFVNRWGRV